MTCHWRRGIGCVLAGLVLAALAACGPVTIQSRPGTFAVPAEAASLLRGQQSVALNNAYPAATQVKIFDRGAGWFADLKQYTDTSIALLGGEMTKKGITVAPQAAKRVTLRVRSVQAGPAAGGFIIRGSLVLDAEYGDGTKSSISAENTSPSDAWRAVDGAIMIAVSRLLRDKQFLDYVNR